MGEEEEMLKIKVSCFREQNIQKQFLRLTYYDRCIGFKILYQVFESIKGLVA